MSFVTFQIPIEALPFMYILSSKSNKFTLGRRMSAKILLHV